VLLDRSEVADQLTGDRGHRLYAWTWPKQVQSPSAAPSTRSSQRPAQEKKVTA